MAPDKQKLLTSLELENNKLHLQVLVDQSSLEVFANHGEKVISTMIYPPKDATGISALPKMGHYYRPSENMGYVAAGQITI